MILMFAALIGLFSPELTGLSQLSFRISSSD
uniref:Uncharacterized protein n=1 Tax=Arundo donax TaxID=35708 RepID=A0A0A9CBB2_ARUDO